MGAGYMVFAVALGGMIGIGWLLNGGASDLLARARSFAVQRDHPPKQRTPDSAQPGQNTPKPKRQDLY